MARKKLGQHFIYDRNILNKIVETSGVTSDDVVVEIGAGPGTLTQMLVERTDTLFSIELETSLYNKLKEKFSHYPNLTLFNEDALKFNYAIAGDFKVVSNIPYQITTPLIFRLLKEKERLKSMTLTIQKEVARRITASKGTKEYGVLSIMVQYYTKPETAFYLSAKSFHPPPKVDSAVVNFQILKEPKVYVKEEALFFRIIRTSFAQRRKMLSNSLKSLNSDIKSILIKAEIDPNRRPETLGMEEFAKLSNLMAEIESGVRQ